MYLRGMEGAFATVPLKRSDIFSGQHGASAFLKSSGVFRGMAQPPEVLEICQLYKQ